MVSERVRIRKTLRTLRALEAANAVVEGFHVSSQCEAGGVHFPAIWITATLFLHLAGEIITRMAKN
jgi:hypothetical protein